MAHTSWLKKYWGPVYGGKKTELAYYKIKKNTTTKETQQEWIVDKILKHKKKGTQVLVPLPFGKVTRRKRQRGSPSETLSIGTPVTWSGMHENTT